MKRPVETDELGPAGVMSSELDGGFDRLGAGVAEKDLGRFLERGQIGQSLGEFDPFRMIVVR